MGPGPITFRPLRRDDFARLATWLAEPRVARWWNHDVSPAAIERDFGTSVDGGDATEMFVVALDGEPIGFIQRYPIGAYAEYVQELSRVCPVPPGALSIDYLIGDPAARDRGVGAAMIGAFVAESWDAYPAARDVVVPVAAGNHGSCRALERAGFSRIAEGSLAPDNPIDPPDHVVYRLERPAT